jgi:hypothetical protein
VIERFSCVTSFREEVRDILCYMLNDEKDEVRMEAIRAIKSAYRVFILKVIISYVIISNKKSI